MAYDIGPKITLKGESEFNAAIRSINENIKETGSAMKELDSRFKDNADSVEYLTEKQKKLETQLENQKKKEQELQTQLDKKKSLLKEQKDEIERLKIAEGDHTKELEQAEKAYSQTEVEVKKLGTALNETKVYINDTSAALEENGKALENLSVEKIGVFGEKATALGETMSSKVTAPIVSFGKDSVNSAAEFESAMSQVMATMGLTRESVVETKDGMVNAWDALGKKAREMGAETAFSAKDGADALNYLALAGYSVEDAMETLPTILSLASAGDMDLARASDMVTDAMSALGDKAGTATSFVDQMAKTASSSNTNVAQLGEALLTVGGTAKNLVGGVTEADTALGILADSGMKGAEGGTILRNVILSLMSPTSKAEMAMTKLGLEVFDASGNMRPLNEVLGELSTRLSTMSDENRQHYLSKIFNKADLKGVQALLAGTANGFQNAQDAIDKCGVSWDKYNDKMWMANGGVNSVTQEIVYNLGVIGSTAEETAEYLTLDYQMDIDDAMAAVQAVADAAQDSGTRWDELTGKIEDSVGAAEQMANTQLDNFNGQLTILDSALSELKISIGNVILPVVKELVVYVQGFVDWLNNIPEPVKTIIVIIGALVAAIGPVLIFVGKMATGLKALISIWPHITGGISAIMSALKALWALVMANPIVAIVAAIIAALVLLYNNCEWFRDAVNEIWANICSFFTDAWDKICTDLPKWWDSCLKSIKDFLDKAIKWVQDFTGKTIPDLVNKVTKWVGELPGKIWQKLCDVVNKVKTWGSNMISSAQSAASSMVNGVVSWISQLPGKIWQKLCDVVNKVKSWGSNMVTAGKNAVSSMISAITSTMSGLASRAWNWGKDMVNGFIGGIKNMLGSVGNAAKSVANKVSSFLHFSRPDEGPLRDYESWMPDMVDGMVRSLDASSYKLTDRIRQLAGDMQIDLSGSAAVRASMQQEIVVPVYMDGREVAYATNGRVTTTQRSRDVSRGR